MDKLLMLNKLVDSKVIAIIRGDNKIDIDGIFESLINGGIKIIEISFTTPSAVRLIEHVTEKYGKHLIIGAGTVLDAETARQAIFAGAKFIFAPNYKQEVIDMCHRYGVVAIPGALTPTEIANAWENGADFVKVFPAMLFGVSYIEAIKAPLPQIPLIAVGGVDIENVRDFLKAGVVAVGVGSSLMKKNLIKEKKYDELSIYVKEFLKKANENN
jgi:2-dehydro-3-deoxyphosphogluconate aldolase/(4S)-4-hydroxy-2-oxoglutarate aldolase